MSDLKGLNDEKLKQVSGGVGVVYTSIEKGDCFNYGGHTFLVAAKDYPELTDSVSIEFDLYFNNINDEGYRGKQNLSRVRLTEMGFGIDFYHKQNNYVPQQ